MLLRVQAIRRCERSWRPEQVAKRAVVPRIVARVAIASVVTFLLSPAVCGQQPEKDRAANQVNSQAIDAWGEAVDGLRMRVVPIAANSDEEKVSLDQPVEQYATDDALTLGAEIQNVSDRPVALQGTRYGDSVTPPWPGKSVSNQFAPLLFTCEFTDASGQLVERVFREMQVGDRAMMLSSGSVETLAPGASLLVLLRPKKWGQAMEYELKPGDYRVRVSYHGPGEEARKLVGQQWAGHHVAAAWTGRVDSGSASFRIADDPLRLPAKLAWGEPVNGLRAAVEFLAVTSAKDPVPRPLSDKVPVPVGSQVQVRLHIENVSDTPISFWSESWRQDDRVSLNDGSGEERELPHSWYSGWANMLHWRLKPGQVAKLQSITLGVAADESSAKKFDHPIGPMVVGPPGAYALRYALRFGGVELRDQKGIVIVPGPGDWTGSLETDWTLLKVRERTEDDQQPTFTAMLQFRSSLGDVIRAGQATVRLQNRGRELFQGTLQSEVLSVEQCPFEEPLTVLVRAPGFEETQFYDVDVQPHELAVLTPPVADPVRFRLVSRDDGKPVAGAVVRLFNRSKEKATVGPYPLSGLQGPVWATSQEDGTVVLDMLQRVDPRDKKLGNNIYDFFIEPVHLRTLFIGPIQAGENLGDVIVGPVLEARGEIHGTKEELDNFAAEWDQPESMLRGDGTVGWRYAESKRLKTARDGDKLTFHLTGLRPGRLRIVSNFIPGKKSTQHVYTRREPSDGDVVFEVTLTRSRDDLIVTSRSFVEEQ